MKNLTLALLFATFLFTGCTTGKDTSTVPSTKNPSTNPTPTSPKQQAQDVIAPPMMGY